MSCSRWNDDQNGVMPLLVFVFVQICALVQYLHSFFLIFLSEVSNQMLELYEQNRVPQSQGSEVDGIAGGSSLRAPAKTPAASEELGSKQLSTRAATEQSHSGSQGAPPRTSQNNLSNDDGSGEAGSVITEQKLDAESKDDQHPELLHSHKDMKEVQNKSKFMETDGEEQERNSGRNDKAEVGELREDGSSHNKSSNMFSRNLDTREGPVGQSPKEAIKMIDKDKVKAALEKRRKARGETTKKKDLMDEDDLIERELEDGVELAAEDEKIKREQRRQNWSKAHENSDHGSDLSDVKGQSAKGSEAENAEEGEMVDVGSPVLNGRKRKSSPSMDRQLEGKKRNEHLSNYSHDDAENSADREFRRHPQENHS